MDLNQNLNVDPSFFNPVAAAPPRYANVFVGKGNNPSSSGASSSRTNNSPTPSSAGQQSTTTPTPGLNSTTPQTSGPIATTPSITTAGTGTTIKVQTSVFRQPKTFEGENKLVKDWIQSWKDDASFNGWNEEDQLRSIKAYLGGSAKHFWKAYFQEQPPTTWAEFEKKLLEIYGPWCVENSTYDDMMSR